MQATPIIMGANANSKRVFLFHVIFNVTTTLCLLPFVKKLVDYSCSVIKDKKENEETLSLKYVDDRLLATPPLLFFRLI